MRKSLRNRFWHLHKPFGCRWYSEIILYSVPIILCKLSAAWFKNSLLRSIICILIHLCRQKSLQQFGRDLSLISFAFKHFGTLTCCWQFWQFLTYCFKSSTMLMPVKSFSKYFLNLFHVHGELLKLLPSGHLLIFHVRIILFLPLSNVTFLFPLYAGCPKTILKFLQNFLKLAFFLLSFDIFLE